MKELRMAMALLYGHNLFDRRYRWWRSWGPWLQVVCDPFDRRFMKELRMAMGLGGCDLFNTRYCWQRGCVMDIWIYSLFLPLKVSITLFHLQFTWTIFRNIIYFRNQSPSSPSRWIHFIFPYLAREHFLFSKSHLKRFVVLRSALTIISFI